MSAATIASDRACAYCSAFVCRKGSRCCDVCASTAEVNFTHTERGHGHYTFWLAEAESRVGAFAMCAKCDATLPLGFAHGRRAGDESCSGLLPIYPEPVICACRMPFCPERHH